MVLSTSENIYSVLGSRDSIYIIKIKVLQHIE